MVLPLNLAHAEWGLRANLPMRTSKTDGSLIRERRVAEGHQAEAPHVVQNLLRGSQALLRGPQRLPVRRIHGRPQLRALLQLGEIVQRVYYAPAHDDKPVRLLPDSEGM